MVMGKDKAIEFLETHKNLNLQVYLIFQNKDKLEVYSTIQTN
jgi:hypothetical protein